MAWLARCGLQRARRPGAASSAMRPGPGHLLR